MGFFFPSERGELHQKYLSSGAECQIQRDLRWNQHPKTTHWITKPEVFFSGFQSFRCCLQAYSHPSSTVLEAFSSSLCLVQHFKNLCPTEFGIEDENTWDKKRPRNCLQPKVLHLAGPWTLSKVFPSTVGLPNAGFFFRALKKFSVSSYIFDFFEKKHSHVFFVFLENIVLKLC